MINKIVGDWISREVFIDGKVLDPKRSQEVINHSPDGFAWGYGGSGPAQLALAILLEFTETEWICRHFTNNVSVTFVEKPDVETAASLHQDFKWEIIAKLPQKDFAFEIDIKGWIDEKIKAGKRKY